MKAIILAAGIGKRLKPITDSLPKCLIELNGTTIVERFLDSLVACGVNEIVMVVGHLHALIGHRIGNEHRGVEVRYLINHDYEEGSVLSLWTARHELRGDLLVMDADVVFAPSLLKKLIDSPHPNCLLMDTDSSETGEEMMLGAVGGRVTQIARHLTPPFEACGEGVGFIKLSDEANQVLLKKGKAFLSVPQNRSREYEDLFHLLFQAVPIGYEPVDGLPWTEIDFSGDVQRAEEQILPRIDALA